MDVSEIERGQLLHHISKQRLRVAVKSIVGRGYGRQPDAAALAAHCIGYPTGDFQQQPGAVFNADGVIALGALVRAVFKELVEQIAIGSMNLDTVKARAVHRIARCADKVVHDAGHFIVAQGPRLRGFDKGRHAISHQHGFGFGGNGRRRNRRCATRLQVGVRNPAHMPELHHDFSARCMDGLGNRLPAIQLLGAVKARHIGVTLGLRRDRGGFGNQQTGAGPLRVVLGHQRRRNCAGRTVAGQRGHHDAVGQRHCAHGHGFKKAVHGIPVH